MQWKSQGLPNKIILIFFCIRSFFVQVLEGLSLYRVSHVDFSVLTHFLYSLWSFQREKQPFADVLQSVLKNFAIFTGKQLCWSLFLIKNFIKKRFQQRYFPVNIAKVLKTVFYRTPPVIASTKGITKKPWEEIGENTQKWVYFSAKQVTRNSKFFTNQGELMTKTKTSII